jgi:hypothetical protein
MRDGLARRSNPRWLVRQAGNRGVLLRRRPTEGKPLSAPKTGHPARAWEPDERLRPHGRSTCSRLSQIRPASRARVPPMILKALMIIRQAGGCFHASFPDFSGAHSRRCCRVVAEIEREVRERRSRAASARGVLSEGRKVLLDLIGHRPRRIAQPVGPSLLYVIPDRLRSGLSFPTSSLRLFGESRLTTMPSRTS